MSFLFYHSCLGDIHLSINRVFARFRASYRHLVFIVPICKVFPLGIPSTLLLPDTEVRGSCYSSICMVSLGCKLSFSQPLHLKNICSFAVALSEIRLYLLVRGSYFISLLPLMSGRHSPIHPTEYLLGFVLHTGSSIPYTYIQSFCSGYFWHTLTAGY